MVITIGMLVVSILQKMMTGTGPPLGYLLDSSIGILLGKSLMVLVIICVIELILITMVLIALENNAQYAKLPPSLSFILSGIVNSICQINFEKAKNSDFCLC